MLPERPTIIEDAITAVVDVADLEQILDSLLDADVVEGAPELREVVEELWPELLHKVKPPLSSMH